MPHQEQRLQRSQQAPIVGGLPDVPGIVVAMQLTPGLGVHMRGLADELLVHDYPGATMDRAEREMLAMAVSAGNDCYFCMDSHGAHATALIERSDARDRVALIEPLKNGSVDGLDARMQGLVNIARTVGRNALELTASDVEAARAAGATDADVQLAVLIAAAFCMYNRMVDGLRAKTPPVIDAYRARAEEIAENGYSAPSAAAPAASPVGAGSGPR